MWGSHCTPPPPLTRLQHGDLKYRYLIQFHHTTSCTQAPQNGVAGRLTSPFCPHDKESSHIQNAHDRVLLNLSLKMFCFFSGQNGEVDISVSLFCVDRGGGGTNVGHTASEDTYTLEIWLNRLVIFEASPVAVCELYCIVTPLPRQASCINLRTKIYNWAVMF